MLRGHRISPVDEGMRDSFASFVHLVVAEHDIAGSSAVRKLDAQEVPPLHGRARAVLGSQPPPIAILHHLDRVVQIRVREL